MFFGDLTRQKHARNKEIDLVTKKGSVKHASNIFAYILIIEINLRKLFLLSKHVNNNNNNIYIIFLRHSDIPNG